MRDQWLIIAYFLLNYFYHLEGAGVQFDDVVKTVRARFIATSFAVMVLQHK